MVSGGQGLRVSGSQFLRVSQGLRVSGSGGLRASGSQGAKNKDFVKEVKVSRPQGENTTETKFNANSKRSYKKDSKSESYRD
jgi:hypothetical protein